MSTLSKDTIAYNIGWDAAMYGLHFFDDWPVELRIGWGASKKKYFSPKKSDKFIRKWIQLRVGAYKRGKFFSDAVTPNYLKMINMGICPVLIRLFTYGTGGDDDWSVDRVDNDRGYERQNLISMSTIANSAKSSLSYEQIGDLVKRNGHVAKLDQRETAMLWATISSFCRNDNDDVYNTNNYYSGFPIAPDAPMNGIMSLQIHLSMSIRENVGMPGLQPTMMSMSLASRNSALAKKMIKRLCKFQARDVSFTYILHKEWTNRKNVANFQNWLKGLRPEYRNMLISKSLKVTAGMNKQVLSENLEKWAI